MAPGSPLFILERRVAEWEECRPGVEETYVQVLAPCLLSFLLCQMGLMTPASQTAALVKCLGDFGIAGTQQVVVTSLKKKNP